MSSFTRTHSRGRTWPLTARLGTSPEEGGVSAGAPGWALANATPDFDFVNNRYWDGAASQSFATVFTVSRASSALAQNADNSWSTFSSNAARLTTNGLLLEGARTNGIRNNTMQGVVPGTPGNPGNNWSVSAGGGSSSVIQTTTEDGLSCIDIRIFGTFAGSPVVQFESSTGIAAASGQTWTTSQFMKVVGGSLTNITNFSSQIFERNSGGTALANSATNFNPTSASLGANRYSHTRTLNQATTAFVTGRLAINTNGSAIDVTIRIAAPQNEQGSFMSSPILTTSAAVTRAADNITVTQTASKNGIYAAKSAYSETILANYNGNENVICNINSALLQIVSTTQLQTSNGTDVATGSTGAGTLAGFLPVAYGFDGTNLTTLANGGAKATTAAAWGATSGTITVGNNAALTRSLSGYLQRLSFSATASNFDSHAGNSFVASVSYTGGSQTRLGQAVGWYNFNGTYGQALRTLLQSRTAFTALCVGDSTTQGISDTNQRSASWPSRLAAYLITKGWTTSTDNFMGDANEGTTGPYLAYNSKISSFGTYSISGVESLGGKAFSAGSSGTALTLSIADSCNAIDVLTVGTGFSEDVLFNGVVAGTITPVTAPLKTRITGSGTPITIARTAGSAFVTGAVCRDTTSTRIDIVNAGRGSSGTAFWTDNSSTSRAINCIPVFAAEVVFIDLLIGDWGDSSGVAAATTKANLDTIINAIIGYGGIPVFVSPHPTPTSIASANRQATFTDQNYDLADQYGIPIIDLHAWLGNDYNNAVAAGYTYDVSSHYNTVGYQAEANFIGAGLYFLAT